MDGLQINQKIRYGYAKAAAKLGQPFQLYRSSTPMDPLDNGNLVGTILAVATQDWSWMKSNKPGNAIWYCCVDGQDASDPLSAQENDYLVGDHTFFVLSKEYQLPMQLMDCNSLIDIKRPAQTLGDGLQGYGGYLSAAATVIVQNMPVSILIYGTGRTSPTKLPTDTIQPGFIVQMPNIGGVDIRTGDIISETEFVFAHAPKKNTGAIQEQYVISATEQTEFGWRLTARQVVN